MRAPITRFACNCVRHLLCLALLSITSIACAQNLLINPNFAGGTLAPWGAGIMVFDSQSASADGTGSVAGTYTGANGVALAMNQCVLVTPGNYYNFAGKVLIPSGQTTPGSVELYVNWYTSSSCGGTTVGSQNKSTNLTSPAAANGTWLAVQGDGIAPVGAQSVWLAGAIFKNSNNSSLQVKFDELSFQLAPVGNVVLTVTRSGASSGEVNGPGINCGGYGNDCTQSLTPNATITITAIPDYYAKFSGWSGGGCSGSVATCTVTANAAKTVDAKFDIAPTFPLVLTLAGTGAGSVAISTEDSDCASACTVFIPENKTTTLTATPAAGSAFAGWSGAGCSGTATCSVTVTATASVTATFNLATLAPAAGVSVPTLNQAMLLLLALCTAALAGLFRGRPRFR